MKVKILPKYIFVFQNMFSKIYLFEQLISTWVEKYSNLKIADYNAQKKFRFTYSALKFW